MTQGHHSPEKHRKHRMAAPLGGLLLVLAAVGLVTIVVFCIRTTMNFVDNGGEKEKFERIILPVLMFDPIPFESLDTADEIMLLQSSIWSAVMNDTTGKYEFSAGNTLTVPVTDVDAAAAKLFGPDVSLTHQTFGELDLNYFYNPDSRSYFIPVYGQIGVYTPRVDEIKKKENDVYALTVGYIPPGNAWTSNFKGNTNEPDPDKFMVYEMKKSKDSYYLTAIKDPENIDQLNPIS